MDRRTFIASLSAGGAVLLARADASGIVSEDLAEEIEHMMFEEMQQGQAQRPARKTFIEKENEEFYYIVKNKEYSGDAELAGVKNRYISEILLANKIADDFMSCSDQNKAFSYIRNSKDINELQKFKNGKLIENLIGQFDIEKNMIIEGNNMFISYINIIKVKK